jgi:hypothetical protein
MENSLYDFGTVEKDSLVTVFDTIVSRDTINNDTVIDWSRFPRGANTFYATPEGLSTNIGTDPQLPWSLEHGILQISAGDTLWVGKGNYGPLNLVINQSGTLDNPIHILGYRDYPGDLNSTDKPTYIQDEYVEWNVSRISYSILNILPERGPAILNNLVGIGVGIRVNGSNIRIENIQIQGYDINARAYGRNVTFKNLVSLKSELMSYPFQRSTWTKLLLGSGIGVTYSDSYIINSIILTDNECGPMGTIYLANDAGIGNAIMLFLRTGGPCPSF